MFSDSVVARIILVCSVALPVLRGSVVSGASLSLAWNPSPSTNAAGYEVYYGLASSPYTSVVNAGTNTTVTVTGLTPGQTYYFAASAYDPFGNANHYSNVITNSVPPLPLLLRQPISQTAASGTIAVLSVTDSSETPVTYQWFVGGLAIGGAVNSILALPQI